MGGPTATLLLRQKLTDSQRARMEADLQSISSEIKNGTIWDWEFWVSYARPIHGGYTGTGRPFGILLQDPDLEAHELAQVEKHFGFEPEQSLQVDALCNDRVDHDIMGRLLLHFATAWEGVIDFGGALLPPLPEVMYQNRWRWEKAEWADVESHFLEMVEGMPGRIVSIEYEIGNGRIWAYHLADAAFLRAWLQHPDFRMIK